MGRVKVEVEAELGDTCVSIGLGSVLFIKCCQCSKIGSVVFLKGVCIINAC